MRLPLENSTIVITGGSKGLGLVCSELLLKLGCRVIVLSRSEGELSRLREQFPDQLFWFATDMSLRASVVAAFKEIESISPQINGIVLNAALTEPSAFMDLTESDIHSNLMVNIAGPIYCLQCAASLMESGRAIFISSESVDNPFPMLGMYAGVKAAMETILNGIRREMYIAYKIKLSIIRAGSMAGTSFSESWSDDRKQSFFTAASALGHLSESGTPMPPSRVADAIIQLLCMKPEATVNMMDVRSSDAF